MRKTIILLAAAALMSSTLAFAESNSNDVLQTVPGQGGAPTTVADADSAQPADMGMDQPVKPAKKHKHHKCKKHCHKKHHSAPATTQ